ncbi:putative membrane protein [Erwinia phage pEa_SNUABM_50]|uniref:Uncharacterized protein n=4 Tax=Eneladusvirus BF TaxID=2560751 RepID=A0A1S6UB45_9CAUD|nr:membrane protein [Serratia phage BF]QOI71331.1 putative membrane protein [Erwinia phage pEa_SNUABM_12]QOI71873.1 putative membrane protein [Erwinia phage pEa_SNUABM_47]QOI72412.1 putative membrane protein [Erwinia phage pEa_SNUABM_50]QXO11539.1 hypothetical protein pEaSNUABM19_00398 [Erwinia phage pEa_SNUABM_19]QXO12087.1 hypothetical protein pEaSNUABM44_00396 [Erwinia phage pEa_SNUABM_44]QXO12640.1 hypothetical protein pEaSNUABM49_00399 [Erwinia phage pEa_SNUABM_49]
MKREAMSSTNLYWFIFFWIAFTCVNIYVVMYKPEANWKEKIETQVKAEYKKNEPAPPDAMRQNQPAYIQMLNDIQKCPNVTDKENNTFYTCENGTKASMIHWTRGDKKGVVTREYNPEGKLILIYGHPDDVY